MTPSLTSDAEDYEPTGDPEHTAYGKDFVLFCTCGYECRFIVGKSKAESLAAYHEKHCEGETTVDVVL